MSQSKDYTRCHAGRFITQSAFRSGSATALAFVSAWSVASPPDGVPGRFAEGRILVQTRVGLSKQQLDNLLNMHGAKSKGQIGKLDLYRVSVPPQAEAAVAAALRHNKHVEFAELDELVEYTEIPPNDPLYPNAWHLPRIKASGAWSLSQGQGVTVAVLDTGVYENHVDLVGQMTPGWNAASNDADTSDIAGHGTKVAGTVAAQSNNGAGVASVAWNARIMPIRVTNSSDGRAYLSSIAAGLSWAADHGAKVANISYDGLNSSSSVTSAAQYMNSKGGVVVVAAGNSGSDPGHSDNPYLITASATTSSDSKASWSSYGYYVDIAAPGVGIWTTTSSGGYAAVNGTSFASPITAGVAALVKAANPNLTPSQVEVVLEDSAVDLGTAGWDVYYGHGQVDAHAAVQAALQMQAADTQPPSASILTPTNGSTIAGLVAVDLSVNDNVAVSRVDLFLDGRLLASDASEPYAFSWDSAEHADGAATLTAYVYDTSGNQGVSSAVTVTVDNIIDPPDTIAPTVSIVNPRHGDTVSRTVSISLGAADNVGVTQLSCYVDGRLVGTGNGEQLNCSWNTRKEAAGTHTLSAMAMDAAGNRAETSIQVIVDGTGKKSPPGKNRNDS